MVLSQKRRMIVGAIQQPVMTSRCRRSVVVQKLRSLMMRTTQGCQIRGVGRSSPMILEELRLVMLGSNQPIRMVLDRAIPQRRRPMMSVVLVERRVQLMDGRSQTLLISDGILMQHSIMHGAVVQVPLMMNRSRLDSLVLNATKVLCSQMLSPQVLGAAEVLHSPKVLGSAKMLSSAHVNTVTTAESASVTTHVTTAHVTTTHVTTT